MQMWMLRYPEGDDTGKPVEAKGIDLSKKTIGGLPMVASIGVRLAGSGSRSRWIIQFLSSLLPVANST